MDKIKNMHKNITNMHLYAKNYWIKCRKLDIFLRKY